MVEEQISDISQDIRSSIAEDSSVPRNVRANVTTGLETYLLNKKDDLDLIEQIGFQPRSHIGSYVPRN
jgi:uncharacterized protein (UPF0147 family)